MQIQRNLHDFLLLLIAFLFEELKEICVNGSPPLPIPDLKQNFLLTVNLYLFSSDKTYAFPKLPWLIIKSRTEAPFLPHTGPFQFQNFPSCNASVGFLNS